MVVQLLLELPLLLLVEMLGWKHTVAGCEGIVLVYQSRLGGTDERTVRVRGLREGISRVEGHTRVLYAFQLGVYRM
jgi:hypothetical protein